MLRFLCSLCYLLFKCVYCSSTQFLSLNRRQQRKRRRNAISRVPAVKLGVAEAAHGHFPAEAGEVPETVVEIVPNDVKIGRNHPLNKRLRAPHRNARTSFQTKSPSGHDKRRAAGGLSCLHHTPHICSGAPINANRHAAVWLCNSQRTDGRTISSDAK